MGGRGWHFDGTGPQGPGDDWCRGRGRLGSGRGDRVGWVQRTGDGEEERDIDSGEGEPVGFECSGGEEAPSVTRELRELGEILRTAESMKVEGGRCSVEAAWFALGEEAGT